MKFQIITKALKAMVTPYKSLPELQVLVSALNNNSMFAIPVLRKHNFPKSPAQAICTEPDEVPNCYSHLISLQYGNELWDIIFMPSNSEEELLTVIHLSEARNTSFAEQGLIVGFHPQTPPPHIISSISGTPDLNVLCNYAETWWGTYDFELNHWTKSSAFSLEGLYNLSSDKPSEERAPKVLGELAEGEVGMIAAPGGSGKTYLALEAGIAVASNIACWSNSVSAQQWGGVFYFSNEESQARLSRRYASISEKLNALSAPFYAFDSKQCASLFEKEGRIHAIQSVLRRYCHSGNEPHPKLIIIDPLKDFIEGSENCPEATAQTMRQLRELAIKFSCAVLLVHHCNQEGSKNGAGLKVSTIRGHGNLVDYCRAIWMVCNAGSKYGTYARYMRLAKNSHGPEGKRTTITMANDDGYPLSEGEEPAGFILLPDEQSAEKTKTSEVDISITEKALATIKEIGKPETKSKTIEIVRHTLGISRDGARDIVSNLLASKALLKEKLGRHTLLTLNSELDELGGEDAANPPSPSLLN